MTISHGRKYVKVLAKRKLEFECTTSGRDLTVSCIPKSCKIRNMYFAFDTLMVIYRMYIDLGSQNLDAPRKINFPPNQWP